jgi:hypothetical protein
MSFLAPLFLLGGLAVTLPVVFHLVRRSAKEQIPFSSLMFLQAAPPRVSKRSRLEHILLLLLRCLALCLLALGFARPFLQRPVTASQPRDTQRKIILLLDTSASMRRQSLWAGALAKAGDILQKIAPGDQVAILAFDDRVRSLVSFADWTAMPAEERAGVLTRGLAGLKPGWGSTRLGPALIRAAEAFAEADKQGQNIGSRQIVVVTDLEEGSRLDGLQGFDWPRGIEVRVEQILAQRPTNAGLQWVVDAGDSAKSETNPAPRLRVSNSSNARQEQFQLRWGGVAGTTPVEVYVPPGQSRVVAAPVLPPLITGERLVLSGDDDEFDNTVYVVQPKPDQVEILFLGEDAAADPAQPLYYLDRAFQPTRRRVVEVKAVTASSILSVADLFRPRLVIVADPLPDARAEALQSFLTNGGGILCLLKSPATAPTVARLAGVESLPMSDVTAPNYAMFGQIDFEHPLFAPFADPRFNDFTKIHFWKYRRLDPSALPGARVVARFDSGDPALLELSRGKGRLFILTSGWQPADSQMALSSKFVPLLYSLLELAGGIKSQLAQFHIGDPVDLSPLAAATGAQPLTLRKPDGSAVQLPPGQTTFADTDIPGLYTVTSAQPPVRFAVNLDPSESRTAPMPVEELGRIGVPLKSPELEPVRQLEQKRLLHDAELEGQQKLWRWLTLAALVVLLVETWLAGLLSRRTTVQHEVSV